MTNPVPTDWRALCAELADSLEEWLGSNSIGGISLDDGTDAELIYRARAALTQPEPPSLKEEALAKTKALLDDPGRALLIEVRETLELNRRALESLPND